VVEVLGAFGWGCATPVARLCLCGRRSRHWSGAPPAIRAWSRCA
jgi:hypothetical protein